METPEVALRRLKAENRKLISINKSYEKEILIQDKIVDVVRDSILSIPEIKIPDSKTFGVAGNEEIATLLMSDIHIGKKTATYNPKVFVKRLGKMQDSMMSIVQAQRSIRPVKKLVIVMNGDFADAEAIYPSQAVDYISIPIIDQIFSVGVPNLVAFLGFCLENFEEVECYCQMGNHGRQNAAKWSSSKSTNWDSVLYKTLEASTLNQPRIKWHIATKDWKSMFKIFDYGFLATHGDMIKRFYNSPYYGMTRQAERWANAYRDKMRLDYVLYSHFHSMDTGMRHNKLQIFVNGSFTTDDTYAEENIGVASVPEQLLFGVHPKFGVTWRYPLNLS
ncbi:MAG TPA: hypothetical protein P5098_02170 [Candidatus Dojkabacteria bacterium]|nr:hypothetical protein [Candidatus Dojkabacteria bacterium]